MSCDKLITQPRALGAENAAAFDRSSIQPLRLADSGQRYYLYVPSTGGRGAPILVAVHGISRNAREHLRAFAPLAERYGAVLVAPRFGRARFPDYQRLGRSGRGQRADLALQQILAEVARRTGACNDNVFLFGFSGGGQFVHRFALAHPHRVAAYVVGAAGWYTFPDPKLPFPRGTRSTRSLPGLEFDIDAFLRIPATVLVGERDVDQDAALRTSTKVVAQQGASRVERGRRWVEAMRAASADRGLPDRFGYRTLPRSAHSFRIATRLDGIAELAAAALFGQRAADGAGDRVVEIPRSARDVSVRKDAVIATKQAFAASEADPSLRPRVPRCVGQSLAAFGRSLARLGVTPLEKVRGMSRSEESAWLSAKDLLALQAGHA